MPRYVAFLRAINVGGHTVKMDALRGLFESVGFHQVETFIASGNVIFCEDSMDIPGLETRIETLLRGVLGYEVATFLRTDSRVAQIAGYRAFPEPEIAAARAHCVGFLKAPLSGAQEQTLKGLGTEIDSFHAAGEEIYWLCRLGQSQSTFSNNVFEKALGVKATFRGLNTVVKLAARYPSDNPAGETG